MPVNTLIQIRKGLASTWFTENPVLASGEPGYDLTNNILKIGDGSTEWNDLPAISPDLTTSLVNGSGIAFSYSSITDTLTISLSGINIVEDNTPQLGGNLDLNSYSITGVGNINFSGNLTANSGLLDQIVFNTGLDDPNLTAGQLQWNSTEGTLDLGLNDAYAMHIGEEILYRVRNVTGSTLLAGQPVYASGLSPGSNNRIEVNLYAADGSIREIRFMGLMTEDLTDNGNNGFATWFGYIRGVDTRGDAATYGTTNKLWTTGEPAWNQGDILYVHPSVPGKLTKIEPKHSISVAIITNVASNGKIFVRPTSYGHLDDNHDVNVSGATNGQFLQYNSSTDYWVPSSSGNFTTLQLNGTTVSVSGHTHTSSDITNFNTAVSGLLPTIANSGDNRILTSTGSSVGINAESNLTFNGSLLNITGSGSFSGNLNLSGQTPSTIASFDANKNIVSLATTTYPSLTELSYVKGVTSSIQTQLDNRALTSTTITAGSGLIGGGSLAANRTIDIGAGDGITVSADSIAVNNTVIRTTGTQTITGNTTLSAGTGVPLTVTNTGTSNSFVVNDESSDTTPFIIDAAGNVGIGTTSPNGKLDVVGGRTFLSANNEPYGLGVKYISTGGTVYFGAASSSATPDAVISNAGGAELIRFTTGGNVGIGTASPATKLHISRDTADIFRLQNTATNGGTWDFKVGGGGFLDKNLLITRRTDGADSADLTIDNSGNIGIGVTTPLTKLHITGTLRLGDWSSIAFTDGNGRTSWYGSAITNTYLQNEAASRITQSGGDIRFFNAPAGTAGGAITWTEQFRISSASQVLIGQAGTAALPVLAKLDDPDTGLWFPSANTLAFSTGGVEALNISSTRVVEAKNQILINNNIATPANYFNSLQMEIRGTSGTVGIGFHRSGNSHVGIYHDSLNQLKFNMNGGTPVLESNAGTILGTGNYNSYAPTLTGGGASGTWGISITGSAYYQIGTGTANNFNTNFSETPVHCRSFREMSSGGPTGAWWFVENMRHTNSTNLWGRQNAWGWEDNANEFYSRNITNGTYGEWVRFLNSSNFTSFAVATTNNTSLNSDSRNTRGVTRLYRRDDNSDYSVQTYWTGARWRLVGYIGDTFHAEAEVARSDNGLKAWCSFGGGTTLNSALAPTAGLNVDTVTRTGVGTYTVTVATSVGTFSAATASTNLYTVRVDSLGGGSGGNYNITLSTFSNTATATNATSVYVMIT